MTAVSLTVWCCDDDPQNARLEVSSRDPAACNQHYAMLQRNLLYTGLTRGKRLVVIVKQKHAVAIAVRNVAGRKRSSKGRNGSLTRSAGHSRGS